MGKKGKDNKIVKILIKIAIGIIVAIVLLYLGLALTR